jgi:NADH:ubiquinone oxidoreductase subunit E
MEAAVQTTTPRYVRASLRHFVSQATTESELPADWTAEEATREIARALGLAATDVENRPQHYELYVRRPDGSAEALRPSIRIGDAVAEGDELAPMPEVTPGAARGR